MFLRSNHTNLNIYLFEWCAINLNIIIIYMIWFYHSQPPNPKPQTPNPRWVLIWILNFWFKFYNIIFNKFMFYIVYIQLKYKMQNIFYILLKYIKCIKGDFGPTYVTHSDQANRGTHAQVDPILWDRRIEVNTFYLNKKIN